MDRPHPLCYACLYTPGEGACAPHRPLDLVEGGCCQLFDAASTAGLNAAIEWHQERSLRHSGEMFRLLAAREGGERKPRYRPNRWGKKEPE